MPVELDLVVHIVTMGGMMVFLQFAYATVESQALLLPTADVAAMAISVNLGIVTLGLARVNHSKKEGGRGGGKRREKWGREGRLN